MKPQILKQGLNTVVHPNLVKIDKVVWAEAQKKIAPDASEAALHSPQVKAWIRYEYDRLMKRDARGGI